MGRDDVRFVVLVLVAAAAALVLVWPRGARAQSAEQLVDEGIALRAEGRTQEAFDRFSRAWTASHTAIARAEMGLAEEALGRWVDAERDVRATIAMSTDEWVARNRSVLTESYARILRHVGWLSVRGSPPGAEVFVGGARIGVLPLVETVVEIGPVTIDVRVDGAHETRSVFIQAGTTTRETIDVVAGAARPAERVAVARTAPARATDAALIAAGAVAGVGVLTVVAGAILTAVALPPSHACDVPCADVVTYNRAGAARTNVFAGDALMVGGGVVLAAGGAWFVLRLGRHRVEVAPQPAGLVVSGRF